MNKKIRIGNDIDITWSILDADEQPYLVEGRDIAVELNIGKKRVRITEFDLHANQIHFVYYGKDQKYLGSHNLKFIENEGEVDMVTFDTEDVFRLMEHSWLALDEGETPETVQLEVVTVSSELNSKIGPRGYSAYEVAVQNGFVGTEEEWLASLVGPEGRSPVITADEDGVIYSDGEVLTEVIKGIKDQSDADHRRAGQDHSRAEDDHARAEADHNALEGYRFFVKSIGEAAPVNPIFNDKWYKTTDNKVYTYTGSWGAGVAAKAGDTVVNIADNNIYMFDGTGLMPIDYPTPIRPASDGTHIIDYTEDVQELYLLEQYFPSQAGIMLKAYNGTVYLRYVSGSTFRASFVPAANNKIYELKVTQSTNQSVPLNTVVGYVIFKDYESFLAKPTAGEPANVVYEVATDPSRSPIINAALQDGLVKTSMIQDGAVTTDKISDEAVSKAKLAQAVQDTLDAADASSDATDTPAVIETLPPHNPYSQSESTFFKGYMLDLTGAYDKGYRAVVFRGATWNMTQPDGSISGTLRAGIIYDADHNVLAQANGTTPHSNQWFILPITQSAKTFVGNKCVDAGGGEVFDVTSVHLIDIKVYEAIVNAANVPAMLADIAALKTKTSFPGTFLPKKIYGVIGDTLQIFKRGCVISQTPYDLSSEFLCGQGKEYERYLEITPAKVSGSVPSNLTIKHRLIDDHFVKGDQTTSDLVLSDTPTSPTNNINVLCVGASTTEGGQWASELKRRLVGSGGAPAGKNLTNITFVGRKEKTASSPTRPVTVNVEATGGWTWKTFYTPQAAVRFTVAGVTSVDIDDVYSYTNGNGQTVKVSVAEVNITEGSGNIRCLYTYDTAGRGVPASATGSITKVSGSGDSSISYIAASEETYCPFLDENNPGTKADFAGYAAEYCNNQIDVAIFYLSNLNAGIVGDADMTGILSEMKVVLDGLHEDFPNAKAIIAPGVGYNAYYGCEYNYGANSNFKTWAALFAQFKYAKAVENFIADDAYKDWCFLADTMAEVDSEYAFPVSTKAVNNRSDVSEIIGTNGAHTTLAGYQMTADAIYRCFVNVALN